MIFSINTHCILVINYVFLNDNVLYKKLQLNVTFYCLLYH